MENKITIYLILLAGLYLLFPESGWSQRRPEEEEIVKRTYRIEREFMFREPQRLLAREKHFGIATSPDLPKGSFKKITVQAKTNWHLDNVRRTCWRGFFALGGERLSNFDIVLYKAYIDAVTKGNLNRNGFSLIPYRNRPYNFVGTRIDDCLKEISSCSTPYFNTQAHLAELLFYNRKFSNSFVASKISVYIDLEVEAEKDFDLNDITKIRIPGVGVLTGADFLGAPAIPSFEYDEKVWAYESPCGTVEEPKRGTTGCDALWDFRFPNKNSNNANRKPIVIAHRGFHSFDRNTPENTLKAVKAAYEHGFRYVEIELRMTRDRMPFLFHDTYMGFTTDNPDLTYNKPVFEYHWDEIKNYHYRTWYWDGYPASMGNVIYEAKDEENMMPWAVYRGEVSSEKLSSIDAVYDYIKDKDMLIFLDIKAYGNKRGFEMMEECIWRAAKKGVLHQVIPKVVRTNYSSDNIRYYNMTLDRAKEYMGRTYAYFKDKMMFHPVDYAPDYGAYTEAEQIKRYGEVRMPYDKKLALKWYTDWMGEGNAIGFEFDFNNSPAKVKGDEVEGYIYDKTQSFYSIPPLNKNLPGYGGVSPYEYAQSKDYRVGQFVNPPLSPMGRPNGYEPFRWSTDYCFSKTKKTLASTDWHYRDNRPRFEFMSRIGYQYLTHDKPDEAVNYLHGVDRLNPNTFNDLKGSLIIKPIN